MMADQAIMTDSSPGKAERCCAWCGTDISHMSHRAKFCCAAHKERVRAKSSQRVKWRASAVGKASQQQAKRKYRSTEYGRLAEAEYSRAYAGDGRSSSAKARYRATERGKQTEAAYRKSSMHKLCVERWKKENWQRVLSADRECRRRRAAERAMALLLMPVHKLEAN